MRRKRGLSRLLEKRKIYVALRGATADKLGLLPIIDEQATTIFIPRRFFARSP